MLILAIDTCLACCAACLFDSAAGRVLAQEQLVMDRGHAEALAPMVQRVLTQAGKSAIDTQRVVVTTGPGTFTGVRIGLSFARAMGLACGIPVVGLDTLNAFRLTRPDGDIALPSGNSGLAFVLRFGSDRIELRSASEIESWNLAGSAPDLLALATWAAGQPAPEHMPEPVYVRGIDARPKVAVKEVGAEAAAQLAALHVQAFEPGWSEAVFASMFDVKRTQALVAEVAGQASGFTLLRTVMDQSELITVATMPERRRMGVAENLLTHAFATAKANGANQLYLEVAQSNEAARQLYAKLGFAETGRRKAYYANGDDAVVMARSLV